MSAIPELNGLKKLARGGMLFVPLLPFVVVCTATEASAQSGATNTVLAAQATEPEQPPKAGQAEKP